jgi:hypothetical protein
MAAPIRVNLRERFGREYRIACEPSYCAEHGEGAIQDDPWLQIIPGARGHVFPWDEKRLAASTNTSGAMARRLKALPYVQVHQDGSDGVSVIFPADRLNEVAELLRLRRRRVISQEERQRLAALSKEHSPFRRRSPISESDSEARPCVPETLVDIQTVPGPKPLLAP